jgi:hypothetical protein
MNIDRRAEPPECREDYWETEEERAERIRAEEADADARRKEQAWKTER